MFLNGDLKSAQQLIAEKVAFRELELRYADHHMRRLFENTQQSVETSHCTLICCRISTHHLADVLGLVPIWNRPRACEDTCD